MPIPVSSVDNESVAARLVRSCDMAAAWRHFVADPACRGILDHDQRLQVCGRIADEAMAERREAAEMRSRLAIGLGNVPEEVP